MADVLNSSDVVFQKLKFPSPSAPLFKIGEGRAKDILVINSNITSANEVAEFENGADKKDSLVK